MYGRWLLKVVGNCVKSYCLCVFYTPFTLMKLQSQCTRLHFQEKCFTHDAFFCSLVCVHTELVISAFWQIRFKNTEWIGLDKCVYCNGFPCTLFNTPFHTGSQNDVKLNAKLLVVEINLIWVFPMYMYYNTKIKNLQKMNPVCVAQSNIGIQELFFFTWNIIKS